MRSLLSVGLAILVVAMAALGLLHLAGEDSAAPSVESRGGTSRPAPGQPPQLRGREEALDGAAGPPAEADAPEPDSIWGDPITFWVVDETTRKPIEGALVRASVQHPESVPPDADGLVRKAYTDAQGVAEVPRCDAGAEYAVRKVGYRVQWRSGQQAETRVELTPLTPFRGQVVDAEGRVLVGAHVFPFVHGIRWMRGDLEQRTDEEGRFTVAGVEFPYLQFLVSHEGYGCARVTHADFESWEATITLGAGAVVEGEVVDGRGHPVPEAAVFLGDRHVWRELRQQDWELERSAYWRTWSTTDAQGHYRIRGVAAPSECMVCARAPDGREGESGILALPDATTRREVVIRVHEVGSIAVSLVEEDTGEAIPVWDVDCTLDRPHGEPYVPM